MQQTGYPSVLVSSGCHTQYHGLGGLNGRSLISLSYGDWKFRIKVPTWSVSGENFLPGLQTAAFSPCSYMAIPQCVHMGTECANSLVSLLKRALNLLY